MMVSSGVTKLVRLFNRDFEEYYHNYNNKLLNKYNRLIRHFEEEWKKKSKLVLPDRQSKIVNIITLQLEQLQLIRMEM
jgi:translation initiation factor 2 alpha subunit (eIF-2alpha)